MPQSKELTAADVQRQYQKRRRCAGVSALKTRLREQLKQLKRIYHRREPAPTRTQGNDWLCDNYYILQREGRQSLRELSAWRRYRRPGELWTVWWVCRGLFAQEGYPVTEDNLHRLMAGLSDLSELTVAQLDFLPLALKLALLEQCHTAAQADDPEAATMEQLFTGLGTLPSINFIGFTEQYSVAEQLLRQDPAEVYPRMAEESRAYYRSLVSRLAVRTKTTERQVAERALAYSGDQPQGDRRNHVGYPLCHDLHAGHNRCARGTWSLLLQLGVSLWLAGWVCWYTNSLWPMLPGVLLLFEGLRPLATALALWRVEPEILPRMEPDPKAWATRPTGVVVSTLLPAPHKAGELKKRMEQLWLSAGGEGICICLLCDFGESDYPETPEDTARADAAVRVVQELNRTYGDRFLLFLRRRTYSKTQQRYAGWERKRGAILQLVRYIKGEQESFYTIEGDQNLARSLHYLIALDSDTNLPFESAARLIATAEHPLNRPIIDPVAGTVLEGYGVLSPRMVTSLTSAGATAFSHLMEGNGGVTAYDGTSQDFYQDLFSESIFSGKGLLDVDAFYNLLAHKFPENLILSHDILEGAYLRVGFVSDIEFTDSAPGSLMPWLARLHRWVRGDWQNLRFIGHKVRFDGTVTANPIPNLSRWMLTDNLRRPLTTVAAFLAILCAPLVGGAPGLALCLLGLFATLAPRLMEVVPATVGGGAFGLTRKFFAGARPLAAQSFLSALFGLITLPQVAFTSVDALTRALWRSFVSKRHLLEWTTAAQSGGQSIWKTCLQCIPSVLSGLLLLWAPGLLFKTLGGMFLLTLPLTLLTARPRRQHRRELSVPQRERLMTYCGAMWRFYEKHTGAEDHWLPPDNLQLSPVWRVAHRTSPTNIGMMLLAVLAAHDCGLIDTAILCDRVENTLTTVEGLDTYHGNLYNWYDTKTLKPLVPRFVSTVDSGNYAACLVALKEGLREQGQKDARLPQLIARLEKIIDAVDLTPFYNKQRGLFAIGWDGETGEYTHSHYDFLMSEARLTSYFALATRQVGRRHWAALSRVTGRCGAYAGPLSWTGTMFEYLMPHLLLPVYNGSLLDEALSYCIWCQQRRGRATGRPWGVSESGFYAFDAALNYQYKAHGVQAMGVKRGLNRELVVSPYSSFLALLRCPAMAMTNLGRLEKLDLKGEYGFYEAADFASWRAAGHPPALVRSYMAHHVGMSMVASANALFGNIMQKRFMADPRMAAAYEFLQEKPDTGAVALDLPSAPRREKTAGASSGTEKYTDLTPMAPRAALLSTAGLTYTYTDVGVSQLTFGDCTLTRPSTDPVTDPQGLFAVISTEGETLSVTQAPFYDNKVTHRTEFSPQGVTYFAKTKTLDCGLRAVLHKNLSAGQFQLVISNTTPNAVKAKVLFYLEPVLVRQRDYTAHPAFSKLGVAADENEDEKILTFSRHGGAGTTPCLAVGFADRRPWQVQTRREKLFTAPEGMAGLRGFAAKKFDGGAGAPDAVCAVMTEIRIAPMGQEKLVLFLAAGNTPEQCGNQILTLRREGELDQKTAASSPLTTGSMEGRMGAELLPRLLWPDTADPVQRTRIAQNTGGQSALWSLGVSGDLPVVVLYPGETPDIARLEGQLRLHAQLRPLGHSYDLAVVLPRQAVEVRQAFRLALDRAGSGQLLGQSGGVHLLDPAQGDPQALAALMAAAVWVEKGEHRSAQPYRRLYHPLPQEELTPPPPPDGVTVVGGVFADGGFYCDRKSPLPWNHILANAQFGTLVSDHSPGCTWALNARENRLTPWQNDIATGNDGEGLYLRMDGRIINLVKGSRAFFWPSGARYEGSSAALHSRVEITLSPTGCAKYCDVTLTNTGDTPLETDCAYYLTPVLGVERRTSRFIKIQWKEGRILMENPWNTAVHTHTVLSCDRKGGRAQTNREDFFEGRWEHNMNHPSPAGSAAVIIPMRLPPRRSEQVRFILSAGRTPQGAMEMSRLVPRVPTRWSDGVTIDTPDRHLNHFFNEFAPHQMIAGRVRGRSGFYQGGGAYGFRDQLQDVCAALLWDTPLAKTQIYRCCAVQFEEGDVLHWWHPLPREQGGLRGVRTRYSDDLLWLPYTVARYVSVTGNAAILETQIPYLAAPPLGPEEGERYFAPATSGVKEDVYHHCLRAIERACHFGERGLPLMGGGDWNDGFNKVGELGRGESVWLAMFLVMVLEGFLPLCRMRGDEATAQQFVDTAARLRKDIDQNCWDGNWYLRAFYDDGTPMGGAGAEACAIDLLPQSFAVLAHMPDRQRVDSALSAAWEQLVDRQHQIIKLFAPPFTGAEQRNPGYVRRYPAGVRENGGQYTHAGVWYAMALMEAGYVDEGMELLTMLNPAHRCADPALADRYKLEPYYMAGDVYSGSLAGRGGWSIYTGAASWYCRAVAESLCGITLRGKEALLSPKLPSGWAGYRYTLRRGGATLEVEVRRASGRQKATPLPVEVKLSAKVHKILIFTGGKDYGTLGENVV